MLILPIKKKWFDMIADHEKEDEWFVKKYVKWIEEEFEKCGIQLKK